MQGLRVLEKLTAVKCSYRKDGLTALGYQDFHPHLQSHWIFCRVVDVMVKVLNLHSDQKYRLVLEMTYVGLDFEAI
jgi:hypothetical protein